MEGFHMCVSSNKVTRELKIKSTLAGA